MPTCKEIAQSWTLWGEYVDPAGTMSYEEWDKLTEEEALALIHGCFPNECDC